MCFFPIKMCFFHSFLYVYQRVILVNLGYMSKSSSQYNFYAQDFLRDYYRNSHTF